MVDRPHDVQPGDIIECHGVKQRVTSAFGAYALEKMRRETMKVSDFKAGLVSFGGAFLSSLCCLLPLATLLLGLGSGAFMMVTIQYRYLLIPLGVLGVGLGYYFYLRDRKRCRTLGCRMPGSGLNLVLLLISSLVVMAAIILDRLPQLVEPLLMGR